MASVSEVAEREMFYRGFRIKVGASVRFGGILVAASLAGGPDGIARQFGLTSTESNVHCACALALHELRKVVDDLLDGRPEAPLAPDSRGASAQGSEVQDEDSGVFDG